MHQNKNFYVRNFFLFSKKSHNWPTNGINCISVTPRLIFQNFVYFFRHYETTGKTVWVDGCFLIVQARQKFWYIAGPKIHCAYGVTAKNVILTFLPLQATPLTVQKIFKNLSIKTSTIVVCPIPKHWLKLIFDQKRPKKQKKFSAIFLP